MRLLVKVVWVSRSLSFSGNRKKSGTNNDWDVRPSEIGTWPENKAKITDFSETSRSGVNENVLFAKK